VSFISFQLSPSLPAQSLRWNLGHENLVFSLSAGGNTHSWLGLEDIEHVTGENTPAECTHTNAIIPPQTLNSDLSHKEKQSWIYIRGACCNRTLQVKCAMWTTSACWPCSAGFRSQFSKQDTVHITSYPYYHCTANQSQATETFPRVWGVLFSFHSCCVSGKTVRS